MKIGVNDKCHCESGKKYKYCCIDKDAVRKEVDSVVEELLDQFEKRGMKYRGTFMEKDMCNNIESLYLQCKYISENLDVSILDCKELDKKKHAIVYRKAVLIQKLIWNLKENKSADIKVFFQLGDHNQEISPEEYVDIILSTFSSIFEHYTSLLRKDTVFNGKKLVEGLGLLELKGSIDSPVSIEKMFLSLCEKTKEKYPSFKVTPLFNMIAYSLRCGSFHNDYSFGNHRGLFSIVLRDGTENINVLELLKLSNDIFAKLNLLQLIPYYFTKGILK